MQRFHFSGLSTTMRLVFSILVALAMLIPAAATPIAADSGGGVVYYRTITINAGKVPSAQTNFPLLINITDSNLRSVENGGHVAQSTGSDIYFTDSTGATQYPYEIDKYDAVSGNVVAWVKVPTISNGTALNIWYGGGGGAANNPANVWTNSFQGVWHMDQPNAADSTANHNNGTAGVGVTANSSGKFGPANNFDTNQTTGYIDCGNAANLDFVSSLSYTWSAWVNTPVANAGGGYGIIGKSVGSGYDIFLKNGNAITVHDGIGGSGGSQVYSTAAVPITGWHYVVVTYSNGSVSIYLDGALNVSGSLIANDNNTSNLFIGYRASKNNGTGIFGGTMDEVRYATSIRNFDWVMTEYNNQNSPETFYTVGNESSATPGSLDHININPTNPMVGVSKQKTFTAQGYDAANIPINGLTYTWNCTNSTAGSIDSTTGVFTAGTTAGVYTDVITVSAGGKTASTSVRVTIGTWYVDASGTADFTSIQAAVDAAEADDTIIVNDGTYTERIVVNKSLTIKAANTHGATVNPASGNIFTVAASNVTIDGFTMTESSTSTGRAISLNGSYSGGVFSNNNISNVEYGIYIVHGGSGTITNNTITLSGSGSASAGISIINSSGNTISGNTCIDPNAGTLGYSDGIYLGYDDTLDIEEVEHCSSNTVSGNTFKATYRGISLYAATNNTITSNSCINNSYGLKVASGIWPSSGNSIYLNSIISATKGTVDANSTGNTWNSPAQVSYWYNGVQKTSYLGNYWGSYYSGTDADNNGIGDTAYNVYTGADADSYPLMFSASGYSQTAQSPSAAFTSDTRRGQVPCTIDFSDQSTGSLPLTYAWDFGDGGTSVLQNPSHTYNASGTYTVSLTVHNASGDDTETKTGYIYIREPGPWYVDGSGNGDFTTIQSAVNAAKAGDTIVVRNGTYKENVTVDKRLTLQAENQHGATVNPANMSDNVFTVTADYVTIDGFTIIGSSTYGYAGITSQPSPSSSGSYCTFINNMIFGCNPGIMVQDYTLVSNNIVTSNWQYGLVPLSFASDILLWNGSIGNTVTNNYCNSTSGNTAGITVFTVSGCTAGNTSYNTISNNICDSNEYGIYVQQSMYNTFYGNTVTNNNYGLYFRQNGVYTVTTGNIFYLNTITDNTTANIDYFYYAGMYDPTENTGNIWNSTSESTYLYNGAQYTGRVGNYWGDYAGEDGDGNGIGDTPYLTQPRAIEYDSYPLAVPASNYIQGGSASPVADFTASKVIGTAPLKVFFTSTSTGTAPLTYAWDFNNDGTIDSTQPSAPFTYTTPGTYTVKLSVTNASNSDEEIKTDFITVKAIGKSWYVGPDGSGSDFTTIQAAIDTALDGETIIIRDGTYNESPTVSKGVTIRSEHGASAVTVNGIITISASNATIDGLTVTDHVTNTVANYYTENYGIILGGSHSGMNFNNVTITNNVVTNGTITIYNSHDNSVTNNNTLGILLVGDFNDSSPCTRNMVTGNTFHDAFAGIELFQAGGNTFTNNICLNNQYGILTRSSANVYFMNSIIGSTSAGYAVNVYERTNIWVSPEPVTYWYNGVQVTGYAGNYWSQYTGLDANNDGIGDTPLTLSIADPNYSPAGTTNIDTAPLMFPAASYIETPQSPVASFTSDLQSGIAGFTVKFINRSSGSAPMTYAWDFGDGETSTLANPEHAYDTNITETTTYTVALTVTNSANTDTFTRTDYITVTPSVAPVAAFVSDVQLCHVPFTIHFTNQSTGSTPLAYAWSFGDSGTSTDKDPSHTYTAAGVYTVSLVVTNVGGTDTETKIDYITVISSNTWTVNAAGGGDFTTIQAAINGSNAGDTIVVADGSYPENVSVNKSLTLRSLNLHGATVNPASGDIFTVLASNVTIDGFTITQSATSTNRAILMGVTGSNNCTFKNNSISNVAWGISNDTGAWTYSNSGIVIDNNAISLSADSGAFNAGIRILESSAYTITNNTIDLGSGGVQGMYLELGQSTISNNILRDLNKSAATYGIYLVNADSDLICTQNTVSGNTFEGTGFGLDLNGARVNTFTKNTFIGNVYGITLNYEGNIWGPAINNVFYLNSFIGISGANVLVSGNVNSPNTWNSPEMVTYYYNGVPVTGYIGNYWGTSYTGTDTDNNGIGDTTYTTRTGPTEVDAYPLVFRADSYSITSQAPVASFTSDKQSAVAGYPIIFNSEMTTGSAPLGYAWDFGDGQTSTLANPAHIYGAAGTYTVSLTVTNFVSNNTQTRTDYVSISPAVVPDAAFSANPTTGYQGFTVTFTDASTGSVPMTWAWDFGDGATSNLQNPTHTYTTVGTFTVSLTVTNVASSDTESKTGYITVNAAVAPAAAFTASSRLGHAPFAVTLTNSSTGSEPITYAWDFGDGQTSTEKSPAHTYTVAGVYTVSLTVTNFLGPSTKTETAYIDVRPAGPWTVDDSGGADFTTIQSAINAAIAGETIVVMDGTYPENITISKALTIRSQNGNTGVTVNPASGDIITISASNVTIDGFTLSQSTTSTAYGIISSGAYNYITIKNNIINNIGTGIYVYSGSSVITRYGYSTITNNTINLSNSGTNGIMLYWSSGATVSGNIVSDPYRRTGTYGIRISRENGKPNSLCDQNVISDNTIIGTAYGLATIGNSSRSIYISGNTFYRNNMLGTTVAPVYSFYSQSNTWSSPTQTYSYNGSQFTGYMGNYWGSYYTGVDANNNGIGDTSFAVGTEGVDAYPLMFPSTCYTQSLAPTAAFSSNVQTGEEGLTISFTGDMSSGAAPLSYAWDFGDSGTSTSASPSHQYTATGTYTVKLTVTNYSGSSDTITKENYIAIIPATAPAVAFTSDLHSGIVGQSGLKVIFTDQTTGSIPFTYAWDFDNNGTVDSTLQNPTYYYTSAGTYTVSLTVTNLGGSNTITKTDFINIRASGPWYVDAAGNGDFKTIQAAVNAASAGDAIIIKTGNYPENVTISKSLILTSETRYGATVNPATGNMFTVSASGVTINGFTITTPTVSSSQQGVYVTGAYGGCSIINNTFTNVRYAVYTYSAAGNTISNNTISLSTYSSTGGVYIQSGSGNTIAGNTINTGSGSTASYGIYIQSSSSNAIFKNTIQHTSGTKSYGFYFTGSAATGNRVYNNVVNGTYYGLRFASSAINNTFYLNSFTGITTLIYTGSVTGNKWISPSPVTYWFNSQSFTSQVGNYWGSAYTGSDIDPNDGIGDTAFTVNGADQDTKPLMASISGPFYTINASAGENGSITPSANSIIQTGLNQTYTVSANIGYKVADVLVDNVSQGVITSYTFSSVTADHTISAIFALDQVSHTIQASAGANGSIDPSGNVTVDYGLDQTFTITPANGYHIEDVLVDGGSIGTPITYTFTGVTANRTISATFEINTYTLTYAAGDNGSISGTTPQTVTYGGSGTEVTAVPVGGYHFVSWSDGLNATSRTDTNVTDNINVTASFAVDEVPHTITASAGTGGSINPEGDITVDYNGKQTFTITPASGYHIEDVKVDGASVGPVSSYSFSNVTSDHTISAVFSEGRPWVLGNNTIVGSGSTSGGSITVNPGLENAVVWESQDVAGPGGYNFSGAWTVVLEASEAGDWYADLTAQIGHGSEFAGLGQPVTGTYANGFITFEIPLSDGIPEGSHLALQIVNSGSASHDIQTEGNSFLVLPAGAPDFPLPEAAGWMLFGLGAIGLIAFVAVKRKKMAKA